MSEYICNVCQSVFLDKQCYASHRAMCVKGIYRCSDCDRIFDTRRKLANHNRSHIRNICICEVCNREFDTLSSLSSHKKWHSNEYREIKIKQVLDNPKFMNNIVSKTYGIRCTYKNINVKSKFEYKFCKLLDTLDLNWAYEYMSFNYLKDNVLHRYIPDFYIFGFGFLELKPSSLVDDLVNLKLSSLNSNLNKFSYPIYLVTEKNMHSIVQSLREFKSSLSDKSYLFDMKTTLGIV